MRIKSFFAKSVDLALAEARAELGDDAVLLNTRKVSATQTAAGGYDVTFGVGAETSAAEETAVSSAVKAANAAAKASMFAARTARQTLSGEKITIPAQKPAAHQLASKLLDLRRELDSIRTNLPEEFRARSAAPRIAEQRSGADRAATGPAASELARLHGQMDEIQRLLVCSSKAQLEIGRRVPEIVSVHAQLLASDVDAALAKDVAKHIENLLGGTGPTGSERRTAQRFDTQRLEALFGKELENRVPLAPRLGVEGGESGEDSAVVVLIGPRGVGKTTSLAKLAVSSSRFGSLRPARFLSLDLSRSTAHLQLQSVAATYGVAFQEVSGDRSLARLIAEARRENAVFVDTPGYTWGDARLMEEAAAAFAQCPALDIHLVVPAYMKARDLRECIQSYAPFRPAKLLVTKLDEAKTLGSIYSEAARAGLKLSFITDGPGIPQDIRAVSSEDLLEMAFDRPGANAQHVA